MAAAAHAAALGMGWAHVPPVWDVGGACRRQCPAPQTQEASSVALARLAPHGAGVGAGVGLGVGDTGVGVLVTHVHPCGALLLCQ